MGLAVITYDPVTVLAEFASRRGITFPLLSDKGSETIRRYGILNTTVPESNPAFGYPFPGTFVVNRDGVVTARFFEQRYEERNTISSVLVRLGSKVEAEATKVTAPHLEITSYATDASAAPGTRFSLVLDIVPGSKIHVYAPGVQGYKPIALNVQPPPGLVLRDSHYPASEEYVFPPLNERVQVYQRPFRIIQDIMIDPSLAGQAALSGKSSLTVGGSLHYQACDDRICYMPQTVPLTWTVDLKPLDRERVNR
jgi:DsbC/DsbD-like thiol-disulfide interchange protein